MSGQSLFRLRNYKPPVTASQMHKLREHCREHLLRPSQLADRVLRSGMEFLEQWSGDVCALQVGRERKCLIAQLTPRVLASGWKTPIEHFQPQGASAVFPAPHTCTSQVVEEPFGICVQWPQFPRLLSSLTVLGAFNVLGRVWF